MIRDQEASKRHLVWQPMWDIDGMSSCCAAHVILRLEASYCTANSKQKELGYLGSQNWTSNMPNTLRYVQNNLDSMAYALPFNMVMTAVLIDMLEEDHDSLWICTDNIRPDDGGDVHRGPFSTRGIADWLPKQGLATIYNGSTNARGTVQTWSWHLDTDACHTYCAEQEELYTECVQEINSILPHNISELHTHMRGGDIQW